MSEQTYGIVPVFINVHIFKNCNNYLIQQKCLKFTIHVQPSFYHVVSDYGTQDFSCSIVMEF